MPTLTLVGANSVAANSVSLPTPQKGDLLLYKATRTGSGTAPSLPNNIVGLTTKANGANLADRYGWAIATGTSADTSGTWTNATHVAVRVYRATAGYVAMPSGMFATSTSTTSTISYPTFTLADGSGNSEIVAWVSASNTTQSLIAATGLSEAAPFIFASEQCNSFDTNGGVSSWSTQTASAGSSGNSVSAVFEILLLPMALPASYANLYQHRGGGTNPNQNGGGQSTSTSYKLPPMLASGTGNLCLLWITVDNGAGPSVSDSISGSWGAAIISATSTGNQDSFLFLLPNTASGQKLITVTTSVATLSFQWTYTELWGMATASVTAGSTSSVASAGPSLASGSITPSANNCVIVSYCSKCVGLNGQNTFPLNITAGAGFTLLDACMAENAAAYSDTHAAQIAVQTTATAINGKFTVAGDTDTFNTLIVALKTSPGSGTAPPSTGVKLARMQDVTTQGFPAAAMWSTQAAFLGNCRAVACDDPALNTLTVWDETGTIWPLANSVAGIGWWVSPNRIPNPNGRIFFQGGGGDVKLSMRIFDFYGVHYSPVDTGATIASPGQNVASLTSFTASPSPSPLVANVTVVANIGLGAGPGLAVTSPAGSIWLMPNYTGENDFDFMGNADICSLYDAASSGALTTTYSITSQATNTTSGGFLGLLKSNGPGIYTQPSNQYAYPGQSVTFGVVAVNSGGINGTLTYQWQKNGSDIGGATSYTYTVTPAYPTDATALYSVNVTDPNGTTSSSSAQVAFYTSSGRRMSPNMLGIGDEDFPSELNVQFWF